MGKRAKKRAGQIAASLDRQTLSIGQQEQEAVQEREDLRSLYQQMLGTSEQVRGFGGQAGYTQRYDLNEAMLGDVQGIRSLFNEGMVHTQRANFADFYSRTGIPVFSTDKIGQYYGPEGSALSNEEWMPKLASGEWTLEELRGFKPAATPNPSYDPDYPLLPDYDLSLGPYDHSKRIEAFPADESGTVGFGIEDPSELARLDVDPGGWETVLQYMNVLMDEAQRAAEAGDTESADRLVQEAEDMKGQLQLPGGLDPSVLFNLQEGDLEQTARAGLSSPMARNVGSLIKRATDFQDPLSKESMRFKDEQLRGAREAIEYGTRQATRTLAMGQRAAERSLRDTALGSGGATNINAMAQLRSRVKENASSKIAGVRERAGHEMSQATSELNTWFTGFSADMISTSTNIGQAFISNEAGVRDQFTQATSNLTQLAMLYNNNAAQRAFEWAEMEAMLAAQNSFGSIMGGVLGSVTGSLAGGIGGGLGASIGESLFG